MRKGKFSVKGTKIRPSTTIAESRKNLSVRDLKRLSVAENNGLKERKQMGNLMVEIWANPETKVSDFQISFYYSD